MSSSSQKVTSAAERIAALLDTRPKDFDPEDANTGLDAGAFALSAELAAPDSGVSATKARSKLKSRKTLRDELEPDLPDAYTGRVVSRAALQQEQMKGLRKGLPSSREEDDDDVDDDEEPNDEDEGDEGDYDSQDDEDEDVELAGDSEGSRGSQRRSVEASSAEDGSSSDDDDEDDDGDFDASSLAPQHRQVLEVMAALEQQNVSLFTRQQTKQQREARAQQEKAQHVRNQLTWWESAVGLRIHEQRLLDLGNQLPAPAVHKEVCRTEPRAQELFAEVRAGLADLVADLADTRSSLAAQFPGLEGAVAPAWAPKASGSSSKRPAKKLKAAASLLEEEAERPSPRELSSDEMWERLSNQFERELSFHNAAIDHWNAQVEASSGRTALKQRSFSSINQSILTQIENVLEQNQDQLVQASRTVTPEFRLLGQPEGSRSSAAGDEGEAAADPGLRDALPVKELGKKAALPAGVAALAEPSCPLVYTDTKFYQQLLNDLIAQQGTGSGVGAVDADQLEEQRRTRQRAKQATVDRRASKGRKVRYVVHAKLQGFMAPQEEPLHNPLFPAEELFTSLFGQRAGQAVATAGGE